MKFAEQKQIAENNMADHIMEKAEIFPSMPQAVVKLRALLKKNDIPIKEIENILRQDPGLSTNILRLANSAYFGLSSKIKSLKQAVMLLGVKRFEQIAFSASMNKTMGKAVEGYKLSPGQLWLHSIAVATTAEAVAKFLKTADPNDVFIPALLHDMGKLILGKFVKQESEAIQSLVAQGESSVTAEYMVLGTDHAEIGALLLERWSFPVDIVNAVRWHHDPEYISKMHNRLKEPTIQSDIVYLSNLIFQAAIDNDSIDSKLISPPTEVLKRLGIRSDQYEAIAEKALIWINKLSDELSFK